MSDCLHAEGYDSRVAVPALSQEFVRKWCETIGRAWNLKHEFPFVEVSHLAIENVSVCVPLLSYGHLGKVDSQSQELAHRGNVQIRYLDAMDEDPPRGHSVQSLIPIDRFSDAETFWKNAMSGNLRKKIRRAERSGLKARVSRERVDLDLFNRYYGYTMYRHGTPSYGRRMFESILEDIDSELIIVGNGSEELAAYFVMFDREIALFQWAGFNPNAQLSHANVLGEWMGIQESFKRGLKWFDLGRSSFGGRTYVHKQYWHPEVFVCRTLPEQKESVYEKYALASRLWKMLPRPIADRLGSHVCRRLKDA